MAKKAPISKRRDVSLSRERIVEASIELLDSNGEEGLTFRTLSERLATGPGAIYWHIASKSDLLTAACDAVIARTINDIHTTTPEDSIRSIALALFDVIDDHPWVGSALSHAAVLSPIVRIFERIGQQVRALGVPDEQQWAAVGALISFILGVSTQNAENRRLAKAHRLNRSDFLEAVSNAWSQLDPKQYPFTRSVAGQIRDHDDRVDYLSGIDLILKGLNASQRPFTLSTETGASRRVDVVCLVLTQGCSPDGIIGLLLDQTGEVEVAGEGFEGSQCIVPARLLEQASLRVE